MEPEGSLPRSQNELPLAPAGNQMNPVYTSHPAGQCL